MSIYRLGCIGERMDLGYREQVKERAYMDCEDSAPSPGVDHSSHYVPNPYACTKSCGGQCATCTDYSPPDKEKE